MAKKTVTLAKSVSAVPTVAKVEAETKEQIREQAVVVPKKNNVFRDGEGAVVTEKRDVVEIFRVMYAQDNNGDRATHLTDDEVWEVINSVSGDDNQVMDDRLQAMSEAQPKKILDTVDQPDTTYLLTQDTNPNYKSAVMWARYLDNDDYTNKVIVPIEEAGDKIKDGPLNILFGWYQRFNFDRVYDEKTNTYTDGPPKDFDIHDPESYEAARKNMETWPHPGTKEGDPDLGNKQAEMFYVREIKEDGTSRAVKKWFYRILFLETKHGREHLEALDVYKKKGSTDERTRLLHPSPEGKHKRINAYITSIVGKSKTAIRIENVKRGIEQMPGKHGLHVDFLFQSDNKGNLTTTPLSTDQPIRIRQHGGDQVIMKISQFIRLKPELAVQRGMLNIPGLVGTLPPRKKRGTKADAVRTDKTSIPLPDADTAESQISGIMSQWLDDDEFKGNMIKRLREKPEFNLTFGDLYTELHPLYNPKNGQLRALYDQQDAERIALSNKEAEEKAAKLKKTG